MPSPDEEETELGGRAGPSGPPSTTFGRYRLLEELGRGGMGIVYKALDTELGRVVALKRILGGRARREVVERFVREARAAASLRHPNLVAVLDAGIHDGERYFTTEYVEGGTLSTYGSRPMPPREAGRIVREVALALQAAHDRGLVHRDVKPGNILVDRDGRPLVADFGLAKWVGEDPVDALTATRAVLGTPAYMAPEQALRSAEVGPECDQYALGVVLYELVAGRLPFAIEEGRGIVTRFREDPPPFPPEARVPLDLGTIALKAMERVPSRRYGSMAELASDLARFLEGEPIEARPIPRIQRLWRRMVRRRRVVAPSAALLLASVSWLALGEIRTSRRVDEALDRATVLEESGDLAAARDECLRALELEGGNERARSSLARVEAELEARRADEARRAAESLAEAVSLLETARPALDRALASTHEKGADPTRLASAAREIVERALAKTPGLPIARHLLGRAWDLEGRDDLAEAAWREAIRLDPGFAPPRFALGRLLAARAYLGFFGLGKHRAGERLGEAGRLASEAIEHFDRGLAAPRLVEEEVPRDFALALRALLAGDRETARRIALAAVERGGSEEYLWLEGVTSPPPEDLECFDRALEIRPLFDLALVSRAIARAAAGDRGGALVDLDEVLRFRPRLLPAWLNRASVRVAGRDFEGAIADAGRALEIDPESLAALYLRSEALFERGDRSGALEDLDRLLGVDRECDVARLRRAGYRAQLGDLEGSLSDSLEVVSSEPAWSGAHVVAADAFLRLGRLGDALAACERALELDPGCAAAHANRGRVRHRSGDLDGALRDLTRALELDPELIEIRIERSELLHARGETGLAVADLDLVIERDPGHPIARNNRGILRYLAGDLRGALEDYDAALARDPSYYRAYRNRYLVRTALGDGDGALADADRFLAYEPDGPLLAERAAARLARGDVEGALADGEAAIRVAPDLAGAYAVRGRIRADRGDLEGARSDLGRALALAPPGWPERARVEGLMQALRSR